MAFSPTAPIYNLSYGAHVHHNHHNGIMGRTSLVRGIVFLALSQVWIKSIVASRPKQKALLFALELVTMTMMVVAGVMLGAYYNMLLQA